MPFFWPVLAKSTVGVVGLNPTCLVILGSLALITCVVRKYNQKSAASNISIRMWQEEGGFGSSDVENNFYLGDFGSYEDVLRDKRNFSVGINGIKGEVEADHIPPLDSLRRAKMEPNFRMLRIKNQALYNMVMSLKDDTRGKTVFTIQVLRIHHRAALSTGRSSESTAVRGVLARRIARGEVMVMFKQAMIIAHPLVSQQIRHNAGIVNRALAETILISKERTMKIYRRAFLGMIKFYQEKRIITEEEAHELEQYVVNDGYTDICSSEYREIFDTVKRSKKDQS